MPVDHSNLFGGGIPPSRKWDYLHEPYPRSGVSAERRWLLFP